ncbi:hypothetical protein X801_05411, partial [Opisthorchis viverrini]
MLQPYKPLDTSWQATVADAVKRNYVYRQGVADAGFTNGEIDLRRRNIEVSGDTTKKVPVSWQHAVMLPIINPAMGYPSIKIVRQLLYKRCYCKNHGTPQTISNGSIQRKLQCYGILYVGDLIHEIVKMQKNFKPSDASIHQPILPPGIWKSHY